jgi:hypothetical protein
MAIDRAALAKSFNWDCSEIYKAADAWKSMRRRQSGDVMPFLDYVDLIAKSGLRPNMIGKRRGQYHLARYGDRGPYSSENARFVPQEVNQRERRRDYQGLPDFRKQASKDALMRRRVQCACGGAFTPGMFKRWHGGNCRAKYPKA